MARPANRSRPAARLDLTPLEDRCTPAIIGALDPSFGSGGLFTSNPGATVRASVASGDGGTIVGGSINGNQFVAKINSAGALDRSFGPNNSGIFQFALNNNESVNALFVQSDGTILVAGSSFNGNDFEAVVTKLTAAGAVLQPSVSLNIPGQNDFANAIIAVGSRIIVAGSTSSGNNGFVASLDQNLNANNPIPLNFGGNDSAYALAAGLDGSIFVAGSGGAGNNFAVVRFNSDLTNPVQQLYNVGAFDEAYSIVVHPVTGRVYLGGYTTTNGTDDLAILEINPTTLALANSTVVPGNNNEYILSLTAGPLGTLYAAGVSNTNSLVARFTSELQLDATFAPNGMLTPEIGSNGATVGSWVDTLGRVTMGVGSSLGFGALRVTGGIGAPANIAIGGPTNGTVTSAGVNSTLNGYNTPSGPAEVIPGFGGNVRTAQADVNGDGILDLIVASGPGGGRVIVYSLRDGSTLADFTPFGGIAGGLFVAAGDFNRDGKAEVVVTPDSGNGLGAKVLVFDGASIVGGTSTPTKIADFFGLADTSGAPETATVVGGRVAVGDVNGDGVPDIAVGATSPGGPRITIWDGNGIAGAAGNNLAPTINPLANFFVFEESQRDGAFISLGDVNNDGLADIIAGGGPNGGPRIRIADMAPILAAGNFGQLDNQLGAVLSNFFAGDQNTRGGVRVTVRDIDGDRIADLVTGSGDGLPSQVQTFLGKRLVSFTGGEQAPDSAFDPFGAALPGGVFVG